MSRRLVSVEIPREVVSRKVVLAQLQQQHDANSLLMADRTEELLALEKMYQRLLSARPERTAFQNSHSDWVLAAPSDAQVEDMKKFIKSMKAIMGLAHN